MVGNNQNVKLRLQNGFLFNGVGLGKNKSKDLALIFNGNQSLPSVTLGHSDNTSLKIGANVYALGYPESLSEGLLTITFTKGILSARQSITDCPSATLQTNTAVNHGNSGGPLVNNKGEVYWCGCLWFGGFGCTRT